MRDAVGGRGVLGVKGWHDLAQLQWGRQGEARWWRALVYFSFIAVSLGGRLSTYFRASRSTLVTLDTAASHTSAA